MAKELCILLAANRMHIKLLQNYSGLNITHLWSGYADSPRRWVSPGKRLSAAWYKGEFLRTLAQGFKLPPGKI